MAILLWSECWRSKARCCIRHSMRREVERVCGHCFQVREASACLLRRFQVYEKGDLKAPSSVTAAGSSISGCFCTLPRLLIAEEEVLVLVAVVSAAGTVRIR